MQISKRILLILLSLILCIGTTSCKKNVKNPDEITTSISMPSSLIDVITNNNTEYKIVADFSNPDAKSTAETIANKIYATTGKMLTVHNAAENQFEYEIIVGNVRDGIEDVIKKLSISDFVITAIDNDIVFYATGSGMYSMLRDYIKNTLFSSLKSGNWSFDSQSFLSHSTLGLKMVALIENNTSEFSFVIDYSNVELKNYLSEMIAIIYNQYNVMFKIKNSSSEKTGPEIVFGNARANTNYEDSKLNPNGDFIISINSGDLVISATNITYYKYACDVFVHDILSKISNGTLIFGEKNEIHYTDSKYTGKDYKDYYMEVNKTYDTYRAYYLSERLDNSDKLDQYLIDALIKRMGSGFAVRIGSSSALYDGYIVKLDTNDYSKVTKIVDNDVLIAEEFAKKYFGNLITGIQDGYFNLTDFCNASSEYNIYYHTSTKLAVVTPETITAFGADVKIAAYSDLQYLQRMEKFYTQKAIPEPNNNTEQTRVVIDSYEIDLENSLDWGTTEFSSIHDPSIIVGQDAQGNSVLYATGKHVFFNQSKSAETILYKSLDNGQTWTKVIRFPRNRAATIIYIDGYVSPAFVWR